MHRRPGRGGEHHSSDWKGLCHRFGRAGFTRPLWRLRGAPRHRYRFEFTTPSPATPSPATTAIQYPTEARLTFSSAGVNILEPLTFSFLLLGAMLPYWFSALTMKSVGEAAGAMVEEVRALTRARPARPTLEQLYSNTVMATAPSHAPGQVSVCARRAADEGNRSQGCGRTRA